MSEDLCLMDGFIFGFVDNAVLIFGAVTGLEIEKYFKGSGVRGAVFGAAIGNTISEPLFQDARRKQVSKRLSTCMVFRKADCLQSLAESVCDAFRCSSSCHWLCSRRTPSKSLFKTLSMVGFSLVVYALM